MSKPEHSEVDAGPPVESDQPALMPEPSEKVT